MEVLEDAIFLQRSNYSILYCRYHAGVWKTEANKIKIPAFVKFTSGGDAIDNK